MSAPKCETSLEIQEVDGWDSNPANPRNWTSWRKFLIIFFISFVEFLTPLASMMYAPSIPSVLASLHTHDKTLATLSISIYVLGFIVGPLIFAPLSERYGRLIVYRFCIIFFLIFTVGCALATNLHMLVAFRFLAGCVGAAPIAIGGAMVADLVVEEQLGKAMAGYTIGPILGPLVGPVVGGVVTQAVGWRWLFWIVAIFVSHSLRFFTFVKRTRLIVQKSGACAVCAFMFLQETHQPTLLQRRVSRSDEANQKVHPPHISHPKEKLGESLVKTWLHPLKILFSSPAVFALYVFAACLIGYCNIIYTTLGTVFQNQYHFSSRNAGLAYLSSSTGSLLCLAVFSTASDRFVKHLTGKHKKRSPIFRLPPILIGIPMASGGLCWYGWTIEKHSFWLVPLAGLFVVGFGMSGTLENL
ncbi:MAG: hypothetical protein M1834_003262 [Cirrosporium novae-zelandiae]|nr:MAG: hypothetical protein M1834_003262 [Cirrosporium novae-zelandiae]